MGFPSSAGPSGPPARPLVLFVDDDANILRAFRRVLRPMAEVWEMRFVEGGHAALMALAAEPVGAVVTDLHMPGVDGVAVLRAARDASPLAYRLLLTGDVHEGAGAQAEGLAHGVLAKPCDPELLKGALVQGLG